MNVSHASIHPVEDPPTTDAGNNINNEPRVRMKDIQGMPGTKGGLALRVFQFIFAAAALAVMATTSDFPSVTAFCYLVAAAGLQCLWSLTLAILDIYALLVMRSLQNLRVVSFFAVGDGEIDRLLVNERGRFFFLRNAYAKQGDRRVNNWASEIRNVAYQAEDLINT